MESTCVPFNRFRNNAKAIEIGNRGWQLGADEGLINLVVTPDEKGRLITESGHRFLNLCSCSYLGLDREETILRAAAKGIEEAGVFRLSISSLRVRLKIQQKLDEELTALLGAPSLSMLSCSVITAGVLPLISSGHLSEGKPVTTVFDKHCHFSMALVKPICADEAPVLTCEHNDLDYVEDICRKQPRVAYIADGVYSMGGHTRLEHLNYLQDKYGLILYFDDSHSLSIRGRFGEGFVKSQLGTLNERTLIVASLGKGFGVSGGVLMQGNPKHEDIILRFGGPMGWSQNNNVAGIYGALASVQIHRSTLLAKRQQKLLENIALFDSLMETEQKGNGLPVRMITLGEQTEAVRVSKALFERGFYASAVFFPIVAKGKAGVRIMLRSDLEQADIASFCQAVRDITQVPAG